MFDNFVHFRTTFLDSSRSSDRLHHVSNPPPAQVGALHWAGGLKSRWKFESMGATYASNSLGSSYILSASLAGRDWVEFIGRYLWITALSV